MYTPMEQAKAVADLLMAIAEPNRIQIIDVLRTGPKHVTELSRILKQEVVNVSHHLSVMRNTGLVIDDKRGRFVIYSLHPSVFNCEDPRQTVIDLKWCQLNIPHH